MPASRHDTIFAELVGKTRCMLALASLEEPPAFASLPPVPCSGLLRSPLHVETTIENPLLTTTLLKLPLYYCALGLRLARSTYNKLGALSR